MDLRIRPTEAESTVIEPSPGYVLKSWGARGKVFLNVCFSDQIEAPDSLEAESVRIPMSVGSMFEARDKSDQICDVIDVVVSGSVFNKSLADGAFRDELYNLVRESIEMKHGIRLSPQCKVIKRKYMGDKVRPSCIRLARSSLIQEVDPQQVYKSESNHVNVPFSLIYRNRDHTQSFNILELPHLAKNDELLQRALKREFSGVDEGSSMEPREVLKEMTELEFGLQDVSDPSLYKLRVSSHRLHVNKSGMNRAGFYVWFPKIMDPSTARAEYKSSEKKIILSLKVNEQ